MYEAGVTIIVVLLLVGLLAVATADILTRRLAREIDGLARDGVVSEEQAATLRSRYGRLLGDESRRRTTNALVILGAAVVGLGVILFFAANWDEIPRFVRLALLVAGVAGANGLAFWVSRARGTDRRIVHALVLLGVLLFGASLFLVGQMYHVQAHDPLAFLVWSLMAAAVAVVVRSAALAGLAALTFEAWIVFELLSLEGAGVSSATTLPALLALLGAAYYGAATAAKPWLDRFEVTGPFRTLGLASCAFGLFVLTFPFVLEYARPRDALEHRLVEAVLWGLVAAATAGVALLAWQWRRRPTAPWEAIVLAAVPVTILLFAYRGESGRREAFADAERDVLAEALLFNAVLAALLVTVILAGHANREAWLLNLGVFFAGLQVLGRFVDPTWGLLPRALGFLAVGAAVLALAWVVSRSRLVEARE